MVKCKKRPNNHRCVHFCWFGVWNKRCVHLTCFRKCGRRFCICLGSECWSRRCLLFTLIHNDSYVRRKWDNVQEQVLEQHLQQQSGRQALLGRWQQPMQLGGEGDEKINRQIIVIFWLEYSILIIWIYVFFLSISRFSSGGRGQKLQWEMGMQKRSNQ